MKINLTQETQLTDITFENTNELIGQALDKILGSDTKIIGIYKSNILRECEKITKPFIDLISYYASQKSEEDSEQIVKAFLTYYEALAAKFREVIKRNSYNKYTCCRIALPWLEVEKGAKKDSDFIVRNIATQLQMDINYTLETLYPDP